jgi:hypothetical protein
VCLCCGNSFTKEIGISIIKAKEGELLPGEEEKVCPKRNISVPVSPVKIFESSSLRKNIRNRDSNEKLERRVGDRQSQSQSPQSLFIFITATAMTLLCWRWLTDKENDEDGRAVRESQRIVSLVSQFGINLDVSPASPALSGNFPMTK